MAVIGDMTNMSGTDPVAVSPDSKTPLTDQTIPSVPLGASDVQTFYGDIAASTYPQRHVERRHRNREAQRALRQRRSLHVSSLERQVDVQQDTIARLNLENADLERRLRLVLLELRALYRGDAQLPEPTCLSGSIQYRLSAPSPR
jgi:hypothetical protein